MKLEKIFWKDKKWIDSRGNKVKPEQIGEGELISVAKDKNIKYTSDELHQIKLTLKDHPEYNKLVNSYSTGRSHPSKVFGDQVNIISISFHKI